MTWEEEVVSLAPLRMAWEEEVVSRAALRMAWEENLPAGALSLSLFDALCAKCGGG